MNNNTQGVDIEQGVNKQQDVNQQQGQDKKCVQKRSTKNVAKGVILTKRLSSQNSQKPNRNRVPSCVTNKRGVLKTEIILRKEKRTPEKLEIIRQAKEKLSKDDVEMLKALFMDVDGNLSI